MPRLTGQLRSLTSSTVPLKVASVRGSYWGAASLFWVSSAANIGTVAASAMIRMMTCHVFTSLLLPHRFGLGIRPSLAYTPLLWADSRRLPVIDVTGWCEAGIIFFLSFFLGQAG